MKEKALIVFIRYPEKGHVKTRLAQYLGDDLTLDLYKHFLEDIIKMCQMVDAKLIIAYSISEQKKDEILFFNEQYMSFCQKGDDLGKRMYNALCTTSERGFKKCILIGSDSPDLPSSIINEAFKALDSYDITLGPSTDGGYYLIGFSSERIDYRIFDKVKWGASSVLKYTLRNIEKTGMSSCLLQEWDDIDDISNLRKYYSHYKHSKNMYSTLEFLEQNREILFKWP